MGNNILGKQYENYSRGYTLQHCCVAGCARVCGPAALASLPFPHKMLGVGGWVIIFWAATEKNYSRGYTLQHCCLADCARLCGPAALASLPIPHALKMPGVGGWVIIFWAASMKTIAGAIPCSIVAWLIGQGCVALQHWPPCPSPMLQKCLEHCEFQTFCIIN